MHFSMEPFTGIIGENWRVDHTELLLTHLVDPEITFVIVWDLTKLVQDEKQGYLIGL